MEIEAELASETEVDFLSVPLSEVLEHMTQMHGVNVHVDMGAMEDLVLDLDEPITARFSGISLHSALTHILGPLDLQYVIQNELLVITSQENALDETTIRVYPVEDFCIQVDEPMGRTEVVSEASR